MSDQAFDSDPEAGIRPLVIGLPCRARAGKMKRILCRGSLLVALFLTTGCASETLFEANFDGNTIGQPPSPTQAVGTVNLDGPQGGVLVVAPPVTPSGKWVQIRRPDGPAVVALLGNLSQFRGDGTYVFSTFLYIPAKTGLASIQFEPFGVAANTYTEGFLHLDFMQDNTVRIDDDPGTAFGTFPRDQVFIVQVTLNINASSKAHIVLSGAGASGEANRDVLAPLRAKAQQFGAVRIWMGFPQTGSFDATNIVVTRKT